MRITPTCAVICVHYQHALVPNLDFDSGTALNKLWAPSYDWNSANAWHSFIFYYSPGLQDHVSLTSALTFVCLGTNVCRRQQDWWTGLQLSSVSVNCDSVWHLLPIRLHNHDQGHRQKLLNALSYFYFFRCSSVLLVLRSQSTSVMLEKGFSRYP